MDTSNPTSAVKRRLSQILDDFSTGMGPAETAARRAVKARRGPSRKPIAVAAQTIYPDDIRAYLDAQGFGRLYREDLLAADGVYAQLSGRPVREPVSRMGAATVWLLTIVACVIVLLAIWRLVELSANHSLAPTPAAAPTVAPIAPAPVVAPLDPETVACLKKLEAETVSWCVRALTGRDDGQTQIDGSSLARSLRSATPCGEPAEAFGDSVRTALSSLIDQGRQADYSDIDAVVQCRLAAGEATRP